MKRSWTVIVGAKALRDDSDGGLRPGRGREEHLA